MNTVAKHLGDFHLHCAEHHASLSKCHKNLSTHHAALAAHHELSDAAASKIHKTLGSEHEAIANHHLATAEFHTAACRECRESEKAMMGKAMPLPDGFSSIITEPAPRSESAPRVVPRYGQRSIEDARAAVDAQLKTAILGPHGEQ